MANVRINAQRTAERIKPLHGTVNGPVANHDNSCGTVEAFREIGVPYVRLHDSSFFPNYGGEHTVDISGIFPDFDKDPYDPASYDFYFTDMYVQRTVGVGCRILYRLGQRIEVRAKTYHVHPPKDYKNGRSSASISSAIITKAGTKASAWGSNTGRSGTSRITCPPAGRGRRNSSTTFSRSPQST